MKPTIIKTTKPTLEIHRIMSKNNVHISVMAKREERNMNRKCNYNNKSQIDAFKAMLQSKLKKYDSEVFLRSS